MNDRLEVALNGDPHRRHAIRQPDINVRAVLKEQIDDGDVSILGRQVEGPSPLLGFLIDVDALLQQLLDVTLIVQPHGVDQRNFRFLPATAHLGKNHETHRHHPAIHSHIVLSYSIRLLIPVAINDTRIFRVAKEIRLKRVRKLTTHALFHGG